MRKILIIGGGPIGLYFASLCEKNNVDYLLFEASDELGGQITNLYPEKHIVDVPEFDSIIAKDYIAHLVKQISKDKVLLNSKVNNIEQKDECVSIKVGEKEFIGSDVVIATGLGFYTPRPLGLEGENSVSNILYSLKDFSFLKNKKVAIFGGGDSALDWAKEISAISDDVHLVHRRTEFRGNVDTIKDCKNLKVHLPFVPFEIKTKDGKCSQISIKNVETAEIITIDVDYVLVNYGSIPNSSTFGFESFNPKEKHVLSEHVFVIGDCCAYEGKLRRINPGNNEAIYLFEKILKAA